MYFAPSISCKFSLIYVAPQNLIEIDEKVDITGYISIQNDWSRPYIRPLASVKRCKIKII